MSYTTASAAPRTDSARQSARRISQHVPTGNLSRLKRSRATAPFTDPWCLATPGQQNSPTVSREAVYMAYRTVYAACAIRTSLPNSPNQIRS
jgi:hypothetical protein